MQNTGAGASGYPGQPQPAAQAQQMMQQHQLMQQQRMQQGAQGMYYQQQPMQRGGMPMQFQPQGMPMQSAAGGPQMIPGQQMYQGSGTQAGMPPGRGYPPGYPQGTVPYPVGTGVGMQSAGAAGYPPGTSTGAQFVGQTQQQPIGMQSSMSGGQPQTMVSSEYTQNAQGIQMGPASGNLAQLQSSAIGAGQSTMASMSVMSASQQLPSSQQSTLHPGSSSSHQAPSSNTRPEPKDEKEEKEKTRQLNPPSYPPDVLDNLRRYSVPQLCTIGRELVHELSCRTPTLCAVLKITSEKKTMNTPHGTPEMLLDYCQLLINKLVEIRLRIEKQVPNVHLDAEEFIERMQSDHPLTSETHTEEEREFKENRQRLIKVSSDLKMLDWMAAVSDPHYLKKVDKMPTQ